MIMYSHAESCKPTCGCQISMKGQKIYCMRNQPVLQHRTATEHKVFHNCHHWCFRPEQKLPIEPGADGELEGRESQENKTRTSQVALDRGTEMSKVWSPVPKMLPKMSICGNTMRLYSRWEELERHGSILNQWSNTYCHLVLWRSDVDAGCILKPFLD